MDSQPAFRLSFVTGDTEPQMPDASTILARLRSGPAWDVASIAPVNAQFPLLHVDWHPSHGFVLQCYEHEDALSDFLVTRTDCGSPSVEIELGGQALERWPSELFVPEALAHQALAYFLTSGQQDRALHWISIDAFPRTIIREGREGREIWERLHSKHDV